MLGAIVIPGAISSNRLSFGPFSLDLVNSCLVRDGVELKLRRQAFLALTLLIKNQGAYISYEQLIREAWGGTTVARHTVASTIAAVRQALQEYSSSITFRPKLGYRFQLPASDDLLRLGWHYWKRLTLEGIQKALDCFQRAALQNPSDTAALEGQSACYLVLNTFGMQAPVEVFPKFCQAQERAVALGGWTASLRTDHARMLHLYDLKLSEAETELLKLTNLPDPPVRTLIILVGLLVSLGRFDEAHETVARARLVDPLYPTLPTAEVLLHFCRREFDAAIQKGKMGTDLHPYQHLGRAYYAQALEFGGRVDEALAQYRLATAICPDMFWFKALEARCLAGAGRDAEASKLQEELEQSRFTEYVDAYYMALLQESLGRRDEAFQELENALEEHSPTIYLLNVDPKSDSLRRDPRFESICDKVFRKSQVVEIG